MKKKNIVFPGRVCFGLSVDATVEYFNQPCFNGETNGFVMYKSSEKSYDKLYSVGFKRDKDGNAISIMLKNMMEHTKDSKHSAQFPIIPHEFVVVQDGKSDELSVFYYSGVVQDGMYYIGRFCDETERKLLAYVNGMRKFFKDYARTRREMAVSEYLAVENSKKVFSADSVGSTKWKSLCRKGIEASNHMHAAFIFENRINRSKEQFERDRSNWRNRAVRVHEAADSSLRAPDGHVVLEDGYMEDNLF